MTTRFTSGTTTLSALQVLGYSSTRTAGNILHTVIGRSDMDVTLKPAGLRSGTLEILSSTLAFSQALESLHARAGKIYLTDDDRPEIEMVYVASGRLEVELDPETRTFGILRIDFQEVT